MKNIYPTLKCQEFTPECMPKDDLVRSYGNFTVVSHYSQMRCCKTHFCFRRAVEFASEYYRNKYNVPIFLTDGSLLGVYRHHATQVPWEKDADVMAVLGVVPHFSFANYIDILMSPNNDPNYNQTFKVVKNRRDSCHLFVNNSLCLDISLWVEASPLRGMRYLNYMNREWSNAIDNVPYNVIFPPQHCPWYGSKLKDLCMADMKEYLTLTYGSNVLAGPSNLVGGGEYNLQAKLLSMRKTEVKAILGIYTAFILAVVFHSRLRKSATKEICNRRVRHVFLYACGGVLVITAHCILLVWVHFFGGIPVHGVGPYDFNVNHRSALLTFVKFP